MTLLQNGIFLKDEKSTRSLKFSNKFGTKTAIQYLFAFYICFIDYFLIPKGTCGPQSKP